MTPDDKFALLRMLTHMGLEVRTRYRNRRVVNIEKVADNYVAITYENGDVDKMHIRDFARRRFIAII